MAKLFESNNRERRNDDVMKILLEVLPSSSTDLILLDDLQEAPNGRTTRSSQASGEIRAPKQRVALATYAGTALAWETPTTLFRSVLRRR